MDHGFGPYSARCWSCQYRVLVRDSLSSSTYTLTHLHCAKRSLATFVCILFSLASAAPPSPNAPMGATTVVVLCVAGGAIPGLYAALLIVDRLPRRTVDWMRLGIFMTFFASLVLFLAAASVTMAAICALQITTSMTTSSIAVALLHLRQPKTVEPLQVGLALAIPSIITWASGLLHGNFAVQWPLFLVSFLFLVGAGIHRYIWATQYCGVGYRPSETDVALVDSYTAILSHQITRFCTCCPVSNRPPVTNDGRTIRE